MIKLKSKKQENEINNREVLKETAFEEEAPSLSLAEKLREKKRNKKKKNIKRISWSALAVFFALFVYWGFLPGLGTVPYAMCKIMIELNVPFPQTLNYTEGILLRTGDIRIWFTHIDPFGGFRQEAFLCSFTTEPETGRMILNHAKLGNVDISQSQIDTFNVVMPYLISGGYYDLTYPIALPDSIQDMNLEVDKFRKVNIMSLMGAKR